MTEPIGSDAGPPCPVCGGVTEVVYFDDPVGFFLGQKSRGFWKLLLGPAFHSRFAQTSSGKMLLLKSQALRPTVALLADGLHCKNCRHVVLRYSE